MPTAVVTGGAGFLGSHLCDKLLAHDYRVICLDNLETGSLENIAHIGRRAGFEFRYHDVVEYIHPTVFEEYRVRAVKDRVSTTGTVWLGLTLGCAECHTHKFDPVSHEDYYRLYAVFNNASEADPWDAATGQLTTFRADRRASATDPT